MVFMAEIHSKRMEGNVMAHHKLVFFFNWNQKNLFKVYCKGQISCISYLSFVWLNRGYLASRFIRFYLWLSILWTPHIVFTVPPHSPNRKQMLHWQKLFLIDFCCTTQKSIGLRVKVTVSIFQKQIRVFPFLCVLVYYKVRRYPVSIVHSWGLFPLFCWALILVRGEGNIFS